MATDLQPGDRVTIKAALYSPPGGDGVKYIMHGQTYEVTEEDLARSDADIIFEKLDKVVAEVLDNPVAEQDLDESETAMDFTSPDYAELENQLKRMSLRNAKKFLSREEWTTEGLLVARDAEEAGKDREPILTYIDGRLGQMGEEPTEADSD